MEVLVTGGNGQLGSEIRYLASSKKEIKFTFVDLAELDITNEVDVTDYFNLNRFDYCINAAAYTAVDMAESEFNLSESVNSIGVKNIAKACKENNTTLIHISTDFVFDGNKNTPYTEEDIENPLGAYGLTKLKGEKEIINTLEKYFILRTSWLYSTFGNNFVKTMIRLGNEKKELGVIVDQIGTPTYARDLANVILDIIYNGNKNYGLYHYSNEGVASWYDFAKLIFDFSQLKVQLKPIMTIEYPTPAKRPKYSVMDKTKIKNKLNINIPHWSESLKECIKLLK